MNFIKDIKNFTGLSYASMSKLWFVALFAGFLLQFDIFEDIKPILNEQFINTLKEAQRTSRVELLDSFAFIIPAYNAIAQFHAQFNYMIANSFLVQKFESIVEENSILRTKCPNLMCGIIMVIVQQAQSQNIRLKGSKKQDTLGTLLKNLSALGDKVDRELVFDMLTALVDASDDHEILYLYTRPIIDLFIRLVTFGYVFNNAIIKFF